MPGESERVLRAVERVLFPPLYIFNSEKPQEVVDAAIQMRNSSVEDREIPHGRRIKLLKGRDRELLTHEYSIEISSQTIMLFPSPLEHRTDSGLLNEEGEVIDLQGQDYLKIIVEPNVSLRRVVGLSSNFTKEERLLHAIVIFENQSQKALTKQVN